MSNYSLPAPTVAADIVFHSDVERRLILDVVSGKKAFPASGKNGLLLWGDYGTGKTTLARMLPEEIERGAGGVETIYDYYRCHQNLTGPELMKKLEARAQYMSGHHSGNHYFVLDEVDNFSVKAQASLKSAMGYPNTIFILTTNFVARIDEGVKNRCISINCNAAPANAYLPIAKKVLAGCGAPPIADNKLIPIIERCNGSVRSIADYMERLADMLRVKASAPVVTQPVAVPA